MLYSINKKFLAKGSNKNIMMSKPSSKVVIIMKGIKVRSTTIYLYLSHLSSLEPILRFTMNSIVFSVLIIFITSSMRFINIDAYADIDTHQSQQKYIELIEEVIKAASKYDSFAKEVVTKTNQTLLTNQEAEKDIELIQTTQDMKAESSNNHDVNNSLNNFGNGKGRLKIFVSFSMPKTLLEKLDNIAGKIGGTLVIRGLKDNSFRKTINYIQDIKKEGIKINIDPEAFKKFDITLVPAFVISDDTIATKPNTSLNNTNFYNTDHHSDNTNNYDKLVGNVTIDYVLERFASEGHFAAQAKEYLKRLYGNK